RTKQAFAAAALPPANSRSTYVRLPGPILSATVSVNTCSRPLPLAGATALSAIRFTSVTVADADLLESATLVAVTVTLVCDPIVAGAVYTPLLLTLPTPEGLDDQVTTVLTLYSTVALNCSCWPSLMVALVGEIVTATGTTVRFAVATLLSFQLVR